MSLIPESALPAFTIVHVAISLAAIASGFVVLVGMVLDWRLNGWTAFFLVMTAATSLTGFGFPIKGFTPGIGFGLITLAVMPVVLFARYSRKLTGPWRWIYVLGAAFVLYLNFVVLIVQSFQKIAFLKALAPNQNEPPFLATQIVGMVVFIILTALAVRQFHRQPVA